MREVSELIMIYKLSIWLIELVDIEYINGLTLFEGERKCLKLL